VLAPLCALALCAPSRARAAPLLGADLDPSLIPPDARDAELARLAQSGVRSLRFTLDWNCVEPEPKAFTWRDYDPLVDAARAHDLDVVLVLGPCAEWAVNPAWEVPADQRARSVPRSIDLWERYVGRAVSHFRGRVTSWQVREQPSSSNFRGARSEYLRLLAAAARTARPLDPNARIIVPEPGRLGVATFDRLLHSDAADSFDILGVYLPPPGRSLCEVSFAWAALTQEVVAGPELPRRPRVWALGATPAASQDSLIVHYLLASAFGVERCYLPAKAISPDWYGPLAQLTYRGFLRLGPDLWALLFEGPQGDVVLAWSLRETQLPASDIAPVADPEALAQSALLGHAPGSALAARPDDTSPDQPPLLRLGPRPAIIAGLAARDSAQLRPPARRDVLAARPGLDLQHIPLVYADYSMERFPEFGLCNRPLRALPGGGIGEEARTGRPCIHTQVTPTSEEDELGNPYLYFDVDDAWLYLGRGRVPVAITIECERAFYGEEKLGFNIMYDSTTGHRFTPWQWVDPGYGWSTYRIVIEDASFANRGGFDFRINAKGSVQDLWVGAVTVEKLAREKDSPYISE